MKQRYIQSEGSKCGDCGSDLGRHKIWTIVYSDDPPELLDQVRNGTINRVPCTSPNCGIEDGHIWPSPPFLFIELEKQRAVCVTLARSNVQVAKLLQAAIDTESVRVWIDPKKLLKRTKVVNSYSSIVDALNEDIASVEAENEAMLHYSALQETEIGRVETILETVLATGALRLPLDEITPELLQEIEEFRSALSGDEDVRIPAALEQIIESVSKNIPVSVAPLPMRDGDSILATVLRNARASADHPLAKASFENNLSEAKQRVLELRLVRLCEFASDETLDDAASAPVDSHPELSKILDALMKDESFSSPVFDGIDYRVFPAVKAFLESRPNPDDTSPFQSIGVTVEGEPPSWVIDASQVLNQILSITGVIPESVFEPIAHLPLARAFINAQLGRLSLDQGQLSGAMSYLSEALQVTKVAYIEQPDYPTERLQAVCLEYMADLQLRFGRSEESINIRHEAREIYDRIGAKDGLLHSLGAEAEMWIDLGQPKKAEELGQRLVRETEGLARVDEVRYLADVANVYRQLPYFAETQVRLAKSEQRREPMATAEPQKNDVPKEDDKVLANLQSNLAFEAKAGTRVSIEVEGHNELFFREMIGSEPIRLLFRGLAVAELNRDTALVTSMLGRLAATYGHYGCDTLANLSLDKLLQETALETAGLDAQMYVYNLLKAYENQQNEPEQPSEVAATRREMLQVLTFIIDNASDIATLASVGLLTERAGLLEALNCPDEARERYLEVIDKLERSRVWMRDLENKKSLQSGRWRSYIWAARNTLRLYADDPSRAVLLDEVWRLIQAGRSRVLLDSIVAAQNDLLVDEGIDSVRLGQFADVACVLPDDTAVLEYFLVPSSPPLSGAWGLLVVEPGASTPWLAWNEPDMDSVLEAKNRLTELGDEYEKNVLQYGFESSCDEITGRYMCALELLSDAILPPGLVDQLLEKGYRKLVIAPDSYLHEVPFAALRPLTNGRRSYLGLPQNGTGFQIAYTPSSSIFARWLARDRTNPSPDGQEAALFVDPLGDLLGANGQGSEVFDTIEKELRARSLDTFRFDEARATPIAWFEGLRKHDLIVYFGHSKAGHGDAERAALILNDGSGEATTLSAGEIYRECSKNHFPTESLVVFASCSGGQASLGDWGSDRELTGLSLAHLYAGCGAVIAASRPLLDEPTLVLLKLLLRRLLAGDDAALSLAGAQKDMAHTENAYSHPHFWGYLGLMGVPHWRLYRGDGRRDA